MEITKFAEYEQKKQLQITVGPDKATLSIILFLYNRDSGALEIAESGVWKKSDLLAQRAKLQADLDALDAVLKKFET